MAELENHLKKQQSALTFTQCLQNIDPRDILPSSAVPQSQSDLGSSFVKPHSKSLIHASSFSTSGGIHLHQSAAELLSACSGGDTNENQSSSLCKNDAGGGCDKNHQIGEDLVKNGLAHLQVDGSRLLEHLTSTPKANTWSYRQRHPSGEHGSPETKSDSVSCEVSPGGGLVTSQLTVTHIRASLFNTPDSNTGTSGQTNTPDQHSDTNTLASGLHTLAVTVQRPSCVTPSPPGSGAASGEKDSGQVKLDTNQTLSADGSDVSCQRREEIKTPDPWTYRHQSSETEHVSPVTAGEVHSPSECEGLPSVSSSDENSILVSLSKLKLSNDERDPGMLPASPHTVESVVFATPKMPELSFNSNLNHLCSDFESKLMFSPESTRLCSATPTTMPYGQITLNLGKSHHAAETFRRLSDLKVIEDDDGDNDDLLSHNAPVVVLVKSAVPPTGRDSEKLEIVVDVWVTKDQDLKSSVNHVFPDLVVTLQDALTTDRLLGLEWPRLVTVDVTCEERYTLRQHTVPVQALFLRTDHEANFNIHILG